MALWANLISAPWQDWVESGRNQLGHTAFWVAIPQIVFVNLLLSGDNAVVIAMACRDLPPRQRLSGMIIGAGCSVTLLIVFSSVVAMLMRLPYLKLIGGCGLLFIAAKLLLPDEEDRNEVEAVAHLWRAVRIVVAADIIMSLDNIIAIAATARGNVLLMGIGLAISIPVVVTGAALVTALLGRFPILVWAGAAMLGAIAGNVIVTDQAIWNPLTAAHGAELADEIAFAAAGATAMLVIGLGGLWRTTLQRAR